MHLITFSHILLKLLNWHNNFYHHCPSIGHVFSLYYRKNIMHTHKHIYHSQVLRRYNSVRERFGRIQMFLPASLNQYSAMYGSHSKMLGTIS